MERIWDILFGERGRCIGFISRRMGKGRCLYLSFDTEGSGFALHLDFPNGNEATTRAIRHERVDFRWDDFHTMTYDLLWAPVEQLEDFCEEFVEARVHSQLREVDPLRASIPLGWQSGCRNAFEQLVRAIFLTEPDLFNEQEPVTAVFRATIPGKRGGFLYAEREFEERYISRRVVALCELAFRLNWFVGMRWIDHPCSPFDVQRAAERVRIMVEPPSAHERAEAFLTLVDWLDDKLYDPAKRSLAGLPLRITDGREIGVSGDVV